MMEPQFNLPWWRTDDYTVDEAVPLPFEYHAGPRGVAMVLAYENGATEPGWGLPKQHDRDNWFTPKYMSGKFKSAPRALAYQRRGVPFAYVMRSMNIVCVDIDGKNGGFEHAGRLGPLPPTLAETSKSGDGYHLFYYTADTWDAELGYQMYSDRIGLEQGVDFRGVGCVYHHASQRWNTRTLAPLPEGLHNMLTEHSQKKLAAAQRIVKILDSQEAHEVLMMQDELLSQLAADIPAGRRNNTLFAIGSQLKLAQIDGWEDKVHERAINVGLSSDEAEKLVRNIEAYAV